jgi:hypothetical protein
MDFQLVISVIFGCDMSKSNVYLLCLFAKRGQVVTCAFRDTLITQLHGDVVAHPAKRTDSKMRGRVLFIYTKLRDKHLLEYI